MQCSLAFLVTGFFLCELLPAFSDRALIAAACIFLVLLVLKIIKKSAWLTQALLLCAAVLFASGICYFTYEVHLNEVLSLSGENTVTAKIICKEKDLPYSSSYKVRVTSTAGREISFLAILECEYPSDYQSNEIISGTACLEPFEESINGYPERKYNLSQGCLIKIVSDTDSLCSHPGQRSALSVFRELNESLCARISSVMPESTALFVNCVLLGNKDDLPALIKRDFNRIGLSHMLAISGLHLSILFGGMYLLLSLFSLHRAMKNILMIASLVCFMAITGFSASVVRAACTMIVSLLCYYIGKQPDPATCLCFSVMLICAVNPYSFYDIGLRLSFCAALGIITVGPLLQKKLDAYKIPSIINHLINGFFISWIAITFTLPTISSSYQSLSFASLFTTLLFTPLRTFRF